MSKLQRLFSKKGKEKLEVDEGSTSNEECDNALINEHQTIIPDIEQKLNNWNILELNVSKIYKTKLIDKFSSDYIIKTAENTINDDKTQDNIELLSPSMLKEHKQNYKFLHIGLIQIAVKPLHRLGIDTPVCVCLRDTRPFRFED